MKIIYLDQMHWIGLAKARTGRADGARYVQVLEALGAGVASGKIMLPLSSVHYAELGATGAIRQRAGKHPIFCDAHATAAGHGRRAEPRRSAQ